MDKEIQKKLFTILISCDYVPASSRVKTLIDTLNSLNFIDEIHAQQQFYQILVSYDFLNPAHDNLFNRFLFKRHIIRVKKALKNFSFAEIVVCPKWGHLNGAMQNAFNYIDTEYVLIVQNDLPFIRSFSISDLLIIDEEFQHIRFNKRKNIVGGLDSSLIPSKWKSTQLLKTDNWSDNNHWCRTNYYREKVFPITKNITSYPESIIYPLNKKDPDHWGTYIFGPHNAEPYIKHTGDYKRKFRSRSLIYGKFLSYLAQLIEVKE